MRVLGVDPGLTRCGLGVVDVAASRQATLVGVGVVGSSHELSLEARLLVIAEAVDQWLDAFKPDVLAIERVFAQTNLSTVMGVAQVSGVVMVAAARRGIPVAMHTPSEVKAAVTGNGRADKAHVTAMVTRLLRLDEPPRPADAADALALAIAHAWRSGASFASGSQSTTAAQQLWREAERKSKVTKNKEAPGATWH
ncbi:crossover junction endodeoxyribonuclease RuvC [Arthrobacter psychrochitiniphilus]|uniref:Crossover junction endodeoxyribonuclease RuvC n=1 Tax=Arthrobacter psychrochitiniphilus TaxID=291045 RepID=A0A2V3DSV3_9MICC|nr:crossover junction endodeoxyribonuclease RuvC [Arthrobacter psychrochitiniphilus]PXA65214.1 crossover junction endodeoxyribonuclease RuvC [Arthrobacter psychrochitiniphilus]